MLKFGSAIIAAALLLTTPAAQAAPALTVPAFIKAAVDNPARAEKQRERDAWRHPGEILALAGLKPGDRVIEIAPLGEYFTEIMAEAVGPKGKIYMYNMPYTAKMFGAGSRAFAAAHPNTVFTEDTYDKIDYPKGVDLVTNVLYYHDLQQQGVDTAVFNRKMFEALKPGGRMLVIDHKAEDGSGWRDAKTIHRMGAETIRKEIEAAGFKLVADSDILANPADDRTKMVFAPGTRGHTDQAVLVFEKPKR